MSTRPLRDEDGDLDAKIAAQCCAWIARGIILPLLLAWAPCTVHGQLRRTLAASHVAQQPTIGFKSSTGFSDGMHVRTRKTEHASSDWSQRPGEPSSEPALFNVFSVR